MGVSSVGARTSVRTSMPASRASPVVVVLNLIVAKETDLIAALARPKVLVGYVHVLHTEWATCRMGSRQISWSDGHAGQSSLGRSGGGPSPLCWARAQGKLTITVVHRRRLQRCPGVLAQTLSLPVWLSSQNYNSQNLIQNCTGKSIERLSHCRPEIPTEIDISNRWSKVHTARTNYGVPELLDTH